jgi:glycosyltransferase involved in cell wall biosynthesis
VQAPLFAFAFARAAHRAARVCDVVHAHWMLSAAITGRFVRGRPLVLTVHENAARIPRLLRVPLLGRMLRGALMRAHAVVGPSESVRTCLIAHGVPEERLRVIPCGVTLPPLSAGPRADGWRLLWVGRVVPEKNVPVLIEAFRQVRATRRDAHLVLVGDGPELPGVRRLVEEAGLLDSVSIEGWQPPERIGDYCCGAHAMVISSDEESGPIVALEGMAHGLPLISTPVGIVPDLVTDGENGRIVPAGDAGALADGILSLMRTAERDKMGAAARRAVEPYTWTRTAQQYKTLFTEVLAASGSGRAR